MLCAPRTLPELLTFKALYRQSLEWTCYLHEAKTPCPAMEFFHWATRVGGAKRRRWGREGQLSG